MVSALTTVVPRSRRRGALNAFTIVELLITVTLIATLAALLFPVFSSARARARTITCVSNCRQIGVAITLYATDYDGLLPYACDLVDKYNVSGFAPWPQFMAAMPTLPLLRDCLLTYSTSRDLFRCPADVGFTAPDFAGATGLPANVAPSAFQALGMSYSYATYRVADGIALDQIPLPAQAYLCRDIVGAWHGFGQDLGTRRYNTLLADGHVKTVTGYELADLF